MKQQYYIDQTEASRLVRIFEVNGLPSAASRNLVKQLQRWESHRGMHWVVNRLKLLGQDLLTGSQPIRKHQDGSWYGSCRCVYRLSQRGRRGLRSALRILRIYGRYEERHVTKKDFMKFKESINLTHDYVVPTLKLTPEDRWLARDAILHAKFNMRYDTSSVKSSIGLDVFPHKKTYEPVYKTRVKRRSEIDPAMHLQALGDCPILVLKHYEYLSEMFNLEHISHYERLSMARHHNNVVGCISALTKDRGLKVRFVANPAYLLQVATSRLQAGLDEFLRSMPESCVHDQTRGPKWIQEQFRLGKSISSVDLSKCSDNLPAKEQFSMLTELFGCNGSLKAEISLFESIARAEWSTPYESLFVRWTKGQPLGTNPSFACFTIFHILLVRSIGGSAKTFRVIGDDIVLSDDHLLDELLRVYEGMKVEVSVHKSLFKRTDFAEFAGRLVDRHGIIPVFKASPMRIANDPLGYVRQYGFKALKLLPRRVRMKIQTVAFLPPPIGMGPEKVVAYLPGELVYELYVDKFDPMVGTHSTESLKKWQTSFSSPSVPAYVVNNGDVEMSDLHSETQVLRWPGDSNWVSPVKEKGDFSGVVKRLEDHVLSFKHEPVDKVPSQISELGEILERVSLPAVEYKDDKYRSSTITPINRINRLFRRLREIFKSLL